MSSRAQAHVHFAYSPRALSELELLRTVSQITWKGKNEGDSLSAIGAAVLRVPGLTGFRFEPHTALVDLVPFVTMDPASAASRAFASAAVTANGQTWGEVRIFFEPNSIPPVESPVRFAKFIGQQTGLLLQRLSLLSERQLLTARLSELNQIARRRKLIYGAAGVLAKQRNISSDQAISEIVKYARGSRRKLLAVSESLIFSYDLSKPARPFFRRLASHETTVASSL